MLRGASAHQPSTFLYTWIIFTRDAIFFFIACFNGPTSTVWIVFGKCHSKIALSKQLFIPLESKNKVHLYLGWNLSQQILFPAMKIMCEKIEDTYADVPEVLWFPPDNNSGWCLVARPCNLLSRYSVRLWPQFFSEEWVSPISTLLTSRQVFVSLIHFEPRRGLHHILTK